MSDLTRSYWSFDGTGDALRLDGARSEAGVFDPTQHTNDFTIVACVSTDSVSATGSIFSRWDENGVDKRVFKVEQIDDDVEFSVSKDGTSGGTTQITSASSLSSDADTLIVARYDYVADGSSEMYLDVGGTTASSTSAVGAPYSTTDADVQMGDCDAASDKFFTGKVYWVAYINRKITDTEVTDLKADHYKIDELEPDYYVDFHIVPAAVYPSQIPRGDSRGIIPFTVEGDPSHNGSYIPTFTSLTSGGGTTYTQAASGVALDASYWDFDGSDSLSIAGTDTQATDFSPDDNTDDFTILAYVATDSIATSGAAIIGKYNDNTGNYRSWLLSRTVDDLYFTVSADGSATTEQTLNDCFGTSDAHFVAAKYKYVTSGTSTIKLFCDGSTSETSSAVGPPFSTTSADVEIAHYDKSGGGGYWDGKVYWIAYFNRTLSDEEITAVYDGTNKPWELDPDSYIDFHQNVQASYLSEIPGRTKHIWSVSGDPVHNGSYCPTYYRAFPTDSYWDMDGSGDALRLDGTNIIMPFDPASNNDDFTAVVVFKPDTVSGQRGLVGKWNDSAGNYRCWLLFVNDDDIRCAVSKDGTWGAGHSNDLTLATTLGTSTVSFGAVRYVYNTDGTSELYLDIDSSSTSTSSAVGPVLSSSVADFQISDYDASVDRFFDGHVYYVAYWNRKLSDSELADLRDQKLHPEDLNPDFYVDFHQPPDTKYSPEIPYNNDFALTVEGNPTQEQSNKLSCGPFDLHPPRPSDAGWKFDGTDDYLRIAGTDADAALFDPASNNDDFTVMGEFVASASSTKGLFSKYKDTGGSYRSWMVYQTDSGKDFYFYISKDGGSSNWTYLTLNDVLTPGDTHFFAGKYDYVSDNNCLMKLFIDDETPASSSTARGPVFSTTSADVNIAYYTGFGTPRYFDGGIKWLAYWNESLTDQNITDIRDGVVHPTELNPDFYTDFHQPSSNGGQYKPEIGDVQFTINSNPIKLGPYEPSYGNVVETDNWYDFDGSTDYLNIDGTDPQADLFDPSQHTDDFTVLAFIETDTIASGQGAIFGKFNNNTGNYRSWLFYRDTDDLYLGVCKDGTTSTYLPLSNCLVASKRQFVAAKYTYVADGSSEIKIWCDDETPATSSAAVGPIYSTTSADVEIGHFNRSGGGGYWNGKLYWVAYFNEVLTDEQIEAIRDGTLDVQSLDPDFYIDFHKCPTDEYDSEI